MKATIVEINMNATGTSSKGAYQYVKLVTQAPPWKGAVKPPREHRFFAGKAEHAPIIESLQGMKAGDDVEYTCADDQFKSMLSIRKVSGGAAAAPVAAGVSGSAAPAGRGGDTDERIARAVALKAAVDLLAGGKTVPTPDTVVDMARAFMPFLKITDTDMIDDLQTDSANVSADDDDDVPF